jgi:hypothetical protein
MAFIGGGAEPEGETTIFDNAISNMASFLPNSGWQTQVSFNGGHAHTEELLKNVFEPNGESNTPFTTGSFENLIASYEQKINSGEIKSGDQLMIQINTHGALSKSEEGTHSIGTAEGITNDLTHLSGTKTVSLDRLDNLSKLAKEKGIQLAILDFSCHSGSSLALQNSNTCVITASGPQHYGFAEFGRSFAQYMQKGRNLEDVFLETLYQDTKPSFPMISSPAGNEIQGRLYELMTPYLFFDEKDNNFDKMNNYLVYTSSENQCRQAEKDFDELNSLLNSMQAISQASSNQDQNFEGLKNAIAEYHRFINTAREEFVPFLINPKLSKEEQEICYIKKNADNSEEQTCTKILTRDLLMTNQDVVRRVLSKRLEKGSLTNEAELHIQNRMEELKAQQIKKNELLSQNPSYKTFVDFMKRYPDHEEKSWWLATAVKTEIRKIYQSYYQALNSSTQGDNPCQKFVL